MFGNKTYENILGEMLSNIPDTIEKREGSIVFNALAPAAAELAQYYIALDGYIALSFIDTATGEFLTRKCSEFGVNRRGATLCVKKIKIFDNDSNPLSVSVGTRISVEKFKFFVTKKVDEGIYEIQCETAGIAPNNVYREIYPIDYIENFGSAEIVSNIVFGEDEENDEELRKRCIASNSSIPFGGNIADYRAKIKTIAGVGGVKVYPAFFGAGTVRLVICNSGYGVPELDFVRYVQEIIDPLKSGNGYGLAPIGHVVTVDGVMEVPVSVSCKIYLGTGYDNESTMEKVRQSLSEYLNELCMAWENEESLAVHVSHIIIKISGVEGVLSVANTSVTIGERTSEDHLEIGADNIPVLGEVIIE